MSSKSERKRGAQEARQAFELLRARWPQAFPARAHEIRPLANVTADLQEAFGWGQDYTKGVLMAWKRAMEAASPPPLPAPASEAAPEPVLEVGPSPAPVETPAPEPEQPRTRKLLTLGPAAKEALLKRGLATTEVVATIQRRAR